MTEIVFDHEDFDFETLEEELKVDEQCRKLLQHLYAWLQLQGQTPERASELAYSADYYVRDFLLDFLRSNVLRPQPGQVRFFAGNWYITRTMEPEITVLQRHLDGIAAFYRFLCNRQLIAAKELAMIEAELGPCDYYQERINRFLDLKGDGYEEWERECALNVQTGAGA